MDTEEKLEEKVKILDNEATPEERAILEYCCKKIVKIYKKWKKNQAEIGYDNKLKN